METVVIVTLLALIQYQQFGLAVGRARRLYGVEAPATSGDPAFERVYRVHQNTLEQLVIFIPTLWLFAHFVHAQVAAGLGVVYLIGRYLYARSYTKAADKRHPGMFVTFLPMAIMILTLLVDAVWKLLG